MADGPESQISARRLQAREREKRAMDFRLAGATYQQIGDNLGITQMGAHKVVARALRRLETRIAESAEEVRRAELERLDRMLLGLWTRAAQGHEGAIDRVLKIMERRAKLLGLDMPVKQELGIGASEGLPRLVIELVDSSVDSSILSEEHEGTPD